MASMHHRNVETTPFVDAHAETNGLGSNGQHCRVMTHEDDASCRRQRSLDDPDNIGDGQAGEQGPHGKVLEACRRRRELVAERVVFHVDPDQIIEPWRREAEDTGNLFGVEEIGCLVPVDPHPSKVITQ